MESINCISEDTKKILISNAEFMLSEDYPVILASHYSKFSTTGNRTDFEDIYFRRRHMLNAFILAELAENSGRFMDRVIDGLFLLCEESGWQLPPHNSYSDGLGNQPYADTTRPVLDLFSCETAALLAFAGFLLKDKLNDISPIILSRINHEVTTRIITPYHNTTVWWMGNGSDKTCNWTPWCTQNVLIATIYSDIPEDMKNIIYSKALKSLTRFVDDYGYDGCCDEGALYYRHAGLCLWLALDLLKSQGCITHSITTQKEKLKNIAEYIMNVHVSGPYYINYADCAPNPGPCSAREYLFGKFVESPDLMALAAEDFCNNTDYTMSEEINLYYRLLCINHEEEIRFYHDNSPYISKDKNIWYESTGLAIAHSEAISLAVKAGNNNDSHNHNDVGSITMYVHGKPCLIDLGVESYTARTFSSDRYSIWTMQSSYHNLPEISGFSQLPGPEYKATNVLADTRDTFRISMDIARAYDIRSKITSLVRTVSFDKSENFVTINDIFSFSEDDTEHIVTENFITHEKPFWVDNVLHIGNIAKMYISNCGDCNIEEINITDKRLEKAYPGSVYRIQINVLNNEFNAKIEAVTN